MRLPMRSEWIIASGGNELVGRYPWDEADMVSESLKRILRRANVLESDIGHTTPVNTYTLGASPFGVMDMAGNVWEWQANFRNGENSKLELRGGSWDTIFDFARVAVPYYAFPDARIDDIGFRVLALSSD